jgi:hypothetical protein
MEAGAALYAEGPTAAEAAEWGLTVEEASGPPIDVWPDNLQAVNMFIAMGTQWRHAGIDGFRTGLDYNVLYRRMDRLGLSPELYDQMENDIRILEDAALAKMREK